VIVVVHNGVFLGAVDYFDVINIFLNSSFEMENPPVLKEALKKDVIKTNPDMRVHDLVRQLVGAKEDYALVLDKGEIEGIVTLKDILSVINKEENLKEVRVRTIMSPRVLSFNPGTYIYEAMKLMTTRRYNQIPIVVDKKPEGVVDLRGVVKAYYDYLFEIEDTKNKILVKNVTS
jgi:signal-transduction protein with cAMP-binding, CBS, and nucleotidyltransferase domain